MDYEKLREIHLAKQTAEKIAKDEKYAAEARVAALQNKEMIEETLRLEGLR